MWTALEQNLLGNKILSCSFYLHGFRKYVSHGFPIINLCNPGVDYETPCSKRANNWHLFNQQKFIYIDQTLNHFSVYSEVISLSFSVRSLYVLPVAIATLWSKEGGGKCYIGLAEGGGGGGVLVWNATNKQNKHTQFHFFLHRAL